MGGFADIAGPDRRGEAVFAVIGPVECLGVLVEAGHRDHRAEHFLLDDLIAVARAGDQCGGIVKARTLGNITAAHHFSRGIGSRAGDETVDPVALAGGDQRAQRGAGRHRIAHRDAFDCGLEFGHQPVVHAGMGIDPASRGAILSGIVIAALGNRFDRSGDVGVGQHDHRSLAAQFEMGAFDRRGHGFQDLAARRDIAGK